MNYNMAFFSLETPRNCYFLETNSENLMAGDSSTSLYYGATSYGAY